MTRADRRPLLQRLAFSESCYFSWDNFPANTMAYDNCMPMDSISMFSNTLYKSNMDVGISLRWLLAEKGYSVLLAVCSAICPASFGRILPFYMGQNILANEWIIFMPFICK